MIYKNFQDKKLSALGMGCMRLPGAGYGSAYIDEKQTAQMFDYAIENGVNYFDTAYGYHAGQSEKVVGKLLKRYPRESYFIADKFPGYDLSNMSKVEQIFEEQLQKTGMDYFDFYLFHTVCENNINEYLDEKYGIFEYLYKQKQNGRIKHLGFSSHGNLETTTRFLDAYGKAMEFGQLQLNWLDWTFQQGKEQVELLTKYNIPVWVMEPVRGGKLARLAPKYEEKLRALRPEESTAAWAFRFLQGVNEVTVTLSGMSDFEQVKQNIQTYQTEKPLSGEEKSVLAEIAKDMLKNLMPCTACRYCTPYCPMQLDIPNLLELYNNYVFSDGGIITTRKVNALPEDKKPSACLGCRACEQVCPQNIRISEALADFTERLQ